jgi:biotin carboxylase
MNSTSLEQGIVVCDPVSTGGAIAEELSKSGFLMIKVWSLAVTEEFQDHVPSVATDMPWLGEVNEMAPLDDTCAEISAIVGKRELVGVIVGGETGVILADELSEAFNLRTNGTACKGRRNKSEQQKLVKAAGLRSTREASGIVLADVREFLQKEPMPCIVKPTESCGSDGVKKCNTVAEAEAHFELLMRSQKKAGAQDCAVICQEFLAGKEYVVDHVSRDGKHKCVMVWVYDKRPTNGGEFVYYNMLPVESSDPVAQLLIAYTQGVIDALDIKHGPTHAEVMMTHDGTPCLVEMNCRAHGWDGAWAPLERALVGYSQVEAACDSYFLASAFDALPDYFPAFMAGGQMVELVSNFTGRIEALPGYETIKQLPSFSFMEVGGHIAVGQELELTIDLFTCAGAVILCHSDKRQVADDEIVIRQMEIDGSLFKLA